MKQIKIFFLTLLLLNIAHAQQATENSVDVVNERGARQVLARIHNELGYVQGMVNDARQHHLTLPGRLRLDYDRLQYDLELIRHGIFVVLHEPDTAPREIIPLSGDYRE